MNKTTERLALTYDRPVDVLHLTVGPPQAYEGDGFAVGVEIDYSIETESLAARGYRIP